MALIHSPNIVTNGLVLCLDAANPRSYPGTGTSWYDLSGNGNTLTLTNGPTFDSGNGGSIVFDGVNDYAIRSTTNNLPSGTGTILVWTYLDSTTTADTYSGILGYGARSNATPSNSSLLSIDTMSSTWYVSSAYWFNDYLQTSLTVNKNNWNFVGKIQRNQISINNTTLISGTNTITGSSSEYVRGLNISNTNLTIGSTDIGGGRPIKGKISIVMIYNRELSAAEISQNFNATRNRFGV
jgi:hypothetical protein